MKMPGKKYDDSAFLPHLFEPLRRDIAIKYIQHEWRKLFPHLRGEELWKSIDDDIADWYEALTIRNFWNAVHGITIGFRLTSIVPWITSLNIKWEEKEMPLGELWFRNQEATFLDQSDDFLKNARKYYEAHKNDTAPRSEHSIFVVRKDGKLRVIDGNGRCFKAILDHKNSINAFVGEAVGKPPLYEHWVPTSLLVDLVFWHEEHAKAGRDTIDVTARQITELIRDSSAGQIEFRERAVHKDNEIHMRLLDSVNAIIPKI